LSPNKTVEGYIGGIVFGTIITAVVANWLQIPLAVGLVLGLLSSIISPLGDLAISLLKREANVKDSGVLFPGHGGALDRLDTLLWSVTMAYYLALFVQ
jgi:phosphatidate cytidylyltransferase